MVACKYALHILTAHANMSQRALLDARLAFNIIEGFAVTFAFATQEELQTWSKMRIPRQTDRLAQKMAEMGSKHIGVNFAFGKSE